MAKCRNVNFVTARWSLLEKIRILTNPETISLLCSYQFQVWIHRKKIYKIKYESHYQWSRARELFWRIFWYLSHAISEFQEKSKEFSKKSFLSIFQEKSLAVNYGKCQKMPDRDLETDCEWLFHILILGADGKIRFLCRKSSLIRFVKSVCLQGQNLNQL